MLYGCEPGLGVFVAGVVDGFSLVFSVEEHGLDYALVGKQGEAGYDVFYVVGGAEWLIYEADVLGRHGVEFLYVVVYAQQGVEHVLTVELGGVAEYADFCLGEVFIAQGDGVVYDSGKVGVEGWFSVSGEGDDVGGCGECLHLLELLT